MSFLGMLCLGLFVGGVIGLVLVEDQKLSATNKTFAAIFGAAVGGGIGAFIQYIEAPLGDAVYAYPMGLVLGFIWPFVKGSWALLVGQMGGGILKHPFAFLHVAAVVLASALAFAIAIFPPARAILDAAPVAG